MTRNVPAFWFLFVLLISGCIAQVSVQQCGKRPLTSGLIKGGMSAKIGLFPWLGVWCHDNTTENCFCSVNLISELHAVTAAHCLRPKASTFLTYWPYTAIHFGRFNLADDEEEEESQIRKIVDAVIHENWNTKTDKYDADIAVLRLDKPIKFNARVQPVCLPTAADFVAGSGNGSVVSLACSLLLRTFVNLDH